MTSNIDALKSQIPERYEVVELLGQGGNGVVFKAQDTILCKFVAIKMLTSELDNKQATRFQKEAQVLAKLDHPNILNALDFQITKSGALLLVLDFIEGNDLNEHIEKNGTMSLEQALPLFNRLISGLEYAHLNDVIHRDIKPSNVMLEIGEDKTLTPKLVDFGLSKWKSNDQKLTKPGAVAGSPLYMSPEQARGVEVAIASDIYSLGCLFFFALTGTAPIVGENYMSTVSMKLSKTAPQLKDKLKTGNFPNEIEEIIARMLAIDPSERFDSLKELQKAIEQIDLKVNLNLNEADSKPEGIIEQITNNPIKYKYHIKVVLIVVILLGLGSLIVISNIVTTQDKLEKLSDSTSPSKKRIPISYKVPENLNRKKWRWKGIDSVLVKVFSQGNITDIDLKELQSGRNFDQLFISSSDLTGEGLTYLTNTGVNRIEFANCKLSDEQMSNFGKILTLKYIALTDIGTISATGLKSLRNCTSLTTLKLRQQTLVNVDFEAISNLKNLSIVDISFSKVPDPQDLILLNKLKYLTRISLGGPEYTEEHLKAISKLKNLEGVRFQTINLNAIENGLAEFSNLKHLKLVEFDRIDKFPSNLTDSLKSIKSLEAISFSNCPGVSRKVTRGLKDFNKLTKVSLIDIDLTGKMSCVYDLAKIPNIRRLRLDRGARPAAEIIKAGYPKIQIELVDPD